AGTGGHEETSMDPDGVPGPEPAAAAAPGSLPEELDAAARAGAGEPYPVFVAEAEGRIVACNPEAERVYGRSGAAFVGQPYRVILPADRAEQAGLLWSECLEGRPVRSVESHREGAGGGMLP